MNGGPLIARDIKVAAASVDDVETAAKLKEALRIGFPVYAGVDAEAVAASTGAHIQRGDRTFMHATCFLVDPDGVIVAASYATGPLGRMWAHEIMRSVEFQKGMRAKK